MDFIRKRIKVFITDYKGAITDSTTAWHVKGLGPTFRLISKVRTHEIGYAFGLFQWPKVLHPMHGLLYASVIHVEIFSKKKIHLRGMVINFTIPVGRSIKVWSLQIPLELRALWERGIKCQRLA